MHNAIKFNDIVMDSSTQLLSSTSSLSDATHDNFTEIARKRRRTRTQRNHTSGLNHLISPIQSPKTATEPTVNNQEFMIDLSNQWDNETLVLVHLAKSYKGLQITKRKSATGRNILKTENHKAAETLSNIRSLFGKSIRFIKLDPARKITTATMLKVPHPITPADVMELVPAIKDAERLTTWDSENNILVQTRSIKIQWEGTKLPPYIDLGILGRYETNLFIKGPVRCYKCQKFYHTASTCHARQDTCGLCGGRHRTSICVAKRKADVVVILKCSNCKGDHCTASAKCPYRREIIQRMRPTQQIQPTETARPAKSAWTARTPVAKQSTHRTHQASANRFHMLPQMPTMDDFPDTLHPVEARTRRSPIEVTHKSPPAPRSQTVSMRHVSEVQTPQKKRNHSGEWKQIIRKPTSSQSISVPAPKPQHHKHVETHPEPRPSTSRQHHHSNKQAPLNNTIHQECQMTVRDIVATSQLIMTMQQQLMSQMADIQPNKYIHNIMKAISQSMYEITQKYESCIGMSKV